MIICFLTGVLCQVFLILTINIQLFCFKSPGYDQGRDTYTDWEDTLLSKTI